METKPEKLYHGSSHKIDGPLKPVLIQDSPEHIHEKPAIFGTERADVAALFMFPLDTLASIGFEQDIAYICIWGTVEEFTQPRFSKNSKSGAGQASKDKGGYLYVLPMETFEKVGKEYEWQSFTAVEPIEIKSYDSAIDGMIQNGAQVYFINNNAIFDQIVNNKSHRSPILKTLTSENQKHNLKTKDFT